MHKMMTEFKKRREKNVNPRSREKKIVIMRKVLFLLKLSEKRKLENYYE